MSQSNRLGLLGRKVGMTRFFTDDGESVPVTVVDVSNNRVTQVKTQENDGYVAIQVTFGSRRSSRVTKPQAGHLSKAEWRLERLFVNFALMRRWRVNIPQGPFCRLRIYLRAVRKWMFREHLSARVMRVR